MNYLRIITIVIAVINIISNIIIITNDVLHKGNKRLKRRLGSS